MDRRWLVGGVVAVAAVLAGIWFGRGVEATPLAPVPELEADAPGMSPSAPVMTEGASVGKDTVLVYVSGWVSEPGVVSLSPGARVGDAIARAGGARPGADLEVVNLAQTVADGQQVIVPGPSVPPGEAGTASIPSQPGPIPLNTASADQLEELPGVGPVLAERIVAHRLEVGRYEKVEDLLEVPGIGEAKLASIRDLVAVP
ncbi:MAG: ComEA family DNA-binding protein [Acidimicrobiia bacterium]